MTTGPAGPNSPTVVWARRSPSAENRRRSRSANAGSSSAPTPGSTTTAGCAAAPSGDGAASRPILPWPPPSSPCALCFERPGTATAGTPGQDHRVSADLLADALNEDGLAAFRHLLATFAAAGNQAALALAYTFTNVFR